MQMHAYFGVSTEENDENEAGAGIVSTGRDLITAARCLSLLSAITDISEAAPTTADKQLYNNDELF